MRRRLSAHALVITVAAAIAVFLTIFQRSPEGLIPFGVGEREVRAAPGAPSSTVQGKHDLSALKVFSRTLIRIRDSYVDPARIDPKEMLYGALDSVQFNIPEVLVEADREQNRVTVVVNDKKQTFETSDVDSPWRLAALLKKIMRFVEANMNPGADLAKVEYAAVNGMLSTLDPHSVLLDPETAREMDVSTQGHFGGLGIVIGMRDKKLTVLRPMQDTPAYGAGVKKGDRIVKIDNEITENLTLQESVNRMRGKPGSTITLWVERDDHKGLMRFDIVRDIIRVPSVRSKLLSKDVGYIKIEQFAGRTAKEVKAAMTELRGRGAKGWVLDLRRNPGGLLEQAILVSDLFVNRGTIVTTVSGRERDPRPASRKDTDTSSPIVVLVNAGSASASEIVAGALKNLDRALILGSNTFGKGSVQILYDNPDDSKLKLTIAQYLTPGNLSIQSLGIVPDVELTRMLIPNQNASPKDYVRLLPPSRRYGEKDLKAHLSSRFAKKEDKPATSLAFVYEPPQGSTLANSDDVDEEDEELIDDEADSDKIEDDFEMILARDIIATAGRPSRKQMVSAARSLIEKRRREEQLRAASKLGKLSVDWTAPPKTGTSNARLKGSIELQGVSDVARAGDTFQLSGTVTNVGTEAAYQVLGRIASEDSVFDERELLFGKIGPGETKVWTSHIKIPDHARDRLDHLAFELREARSAPAETTPLKLRIASADRPTFSYSHQLIDDGNGDGLVQRSEPYRLRVTIKNTGVGIAKESTAILRNASGDMLRVDKARFELGDLKTGEEKTVEFAFQATESAKNEVVVEMSVYDSKLGESVVEKLKYPVRAEAAGPASATGSAEVKRVATVYEGAATSSAAVATAKPGTVFKVTGKTGGWLRVDLDGRPGFVLADDVRRVNRGPRLSSVSAIWQVTPPKLEVNVPSYEIVGDRYRLRGKVTDDTLVSDFFVYVSNNDAKVENKKVYYRSNRGGARKNSMSIDAPIPLWPGSNAVTIVARENGEVQASHTLYLYRSDGKDRTVAHETK